MLGIYTRLSKEDPENNSIQNQIREGESFAKEHKLEYKLFDEGQGLSGGLSIEDRPQLLELTNAIKKGVLTAVWFRDQNRLERNSKTFIYFVDLIKANNCDVYYADKKIDYTDPDVAFQGTMYSAFSQLIKDKQSVKTIKALKDNAKQGKTHAISPFGYTKDDNRYIIIEGSEAEIVKRIYKMSLEGIGTNKIAEIFNDERIPTRYNKIGTGTLKTIYNGRVTITNKKDIKWAGNTIRSIIKNPIYKGERHLKSGVYKAPEIMTKQYWQKVNDNLKANRNNSGKSVKHKYLLKGIITCVKCGRNYYGRTRVNKKDNYYMCSSKRIKTENCGNRSINIDVLENLIWQRFFIEKELLTATENYFKDTDSESKLTQIRTDIKPIEDELEQNEKQRKKAVSLAIKGILNDDDIATEMRELKRNKNDLEIKLNHLLDDESYYVNIDLNKEKEVTDLNDIYTGASFNKKRDIIHKYIKEISVSYHPAIEKNDGMYLLFFKYNNIEADVMLSLFRKTGAVTNFDKEDVKDFRAKLQKAIDS